MRAFLGGCERASERTDGLEEIERGSYALYVRVASDEMEK